MSYLMHRNFRPTSKFSSNLIVYLLFLFFAVSKKKKESLWNIFFLITQPFLYLEGALKLISQEQFKNTTTKIFQVRQQFRGLTKISTHRIWHGEHITDTKIQVSFTNFDFKKYGIQNWLKIIRSNEVKKHLCLYYRMTLQWKDTQS